MKIKTAIYLVLFFAGIVGGCTIEQETSYNPVPPVVDVADGEAAAQIAMIVPEHSEPTTYAMTATQENGISSIDVLSFVNDTLAYRITVSDPLKIVDAASAVNGDRKTVDVKLRRNAAPQKLVVIANATSIINGAGIAGGDSLEVVMRNLIYLGYPTSGWNHTTPEPFPMWGLSTAITVQDPVVMNPVEVSMIRSLAKVNVGVDIFAEDPAIGFASHFKIKNVYVNNVNNRFYISPVRVSANYDATNKKALHASIPSGASTISLTPPYSYPTTGHLTNTIYIPESDTLATVVNRTHLVIEAEYDGGAAKFYRLDFAVSSSQYYQILRNHRYTFNIRGILHDGYSSAALASASRGENLEYELNAVNESNIKDYIYDGQYYLGTSFSQLITAPTTINSTGYQIFITSNYSNSFTFTASGPVVPSGTNPITVSFPGSIPDNVYYRDGSVTITAGGTLSKVIPMRQFNNPSCILATGFSTSYSGAYSAYSKSTIQFSTANLDGVMRAPSGSYQLRIIWSDRATSTTVFAREYTSSWPPPYSTGTQEFAFLSTGNGNAVIGLFANPYNTGDKPLWTWHFWRVGGYDATTEQKNVRGVIFMDRNVGATLTGDTVSAAGLFYQWGRKEPFPSAAAYNSTNFRSGYYYDYPSSTMVAGTTLGAFQNRDVASLSGLPEYAHRNPNIFITSTAAPYYTWEGLSVADNSLWTATGIRSPHDPCPMGWRVPTSAELMSLIGVTNSAVSHGLLFEGDLHLPFAGGIDFSTGQLFGVGTDGYYWTSDTSGATAKVLHIRNGSVTIENAFRANGYSVRCVKDKI